MTDAAAITARLAERDQYHTDRAAWAKLAEKLGLITDDSGRVRLGDVDCIAATIRAR